jgi:hypothetical protein
LDTWIDRNLIRVLLGTSALKEGAVVAVEEKRRKKKRKENLSHRKEDETNHRRCKHSPRKKGMVINR